MQLNINTASLIVLFCSAFAAQASPLPGPVSDISARQNNQNNNNNHNAAQAAQAGPQNNNPATNNGGKNGPGGAGGVRPSFPSSNERN